MPCNSDYMDASSSEINLSRVLLLLDELDGKGAPDPHGDQWAGYDKRVYSRGTTKSLLNEKVALLCSRLQKIDVTKYSLEMQVWWRNHQCADRKREKMERAKSETAKVKAAALKKLTTKEKKALGLL